MTLRKPDSHLNNSCAFFNTDAICLKTLEGKNNSIVIFLFTKEFGPLVVFSKISLKKKSNTLSNLDIGQEISVTLNKKNDSYYLKECSLKTCFNYSDYSALILSGFVLEISSNLPEEIAIKFDVFYNLLLKTLGAISEKKAPFNHVINFQIKLLEFTGNSGDVLFCSKCQNKIPENENSYAENNYWNFFCKDCYNGSNNTLILNNEERVILSQWMNSETSSNISDIHLAKPIVIKIQKYLFQVYADMFTLKTLPQLAQLLNEKLK